ncbi:MucB/RseB C-terminal domain-containing protein [Orbus mooreae]|uniref:MucB/RseB C-terminal domain-containing protein n=1 Tax=Orbus mooreae TaxID=3074107 RepID=UPI00370D8364
MIINLFKVNDYKITLKQLKISLVAFLFMFSFSVSASSAIQNNSSDSPVTSANDSPISILYNMQDAVLHSDYQIYYVVEESAEDSRTLRYRHLNINDNSYAQLLYLEGSAKEIILYADTVSYFQPESASFSFPTKRIIEAFPDVIYSNFNELSKYYDFVLLGKARTANRNSKLIRIVPKDKDRYNYVVWIDDESHLPLRIDLLDLETNIIRQQKVLSVDMNFDKQKFKNNLESRNYPILFPANSKNKDFNSWQVNWLPNGFTESAAYNVNYEQLTIDTRLFSDGIFSFTVNVSEASSPEKTTHIVTQGIKTIYSTNLNNMNVVIIGNIPLDTIEKIAKNISNK